MAAPRLWLPRRKREAVRFQYGAVHCRQEFDFLGYVTSEPYEIENSGGFTPNVFLLADHGYSTYATTIVARRDTVDNNPDLVRRFVEASAIGRRHYLYGDNAKANAAIKAANPDIADSEIAYAIAKMKEYCVIDSGDALTMGIGAMTDARIQDFYDKMVKAGVVEAGLDVKKAYTLQFVDHGVVVDPGPEVEFCSLEFS